MLLILVVADKPFQLKLVGVAQTAVLLRRRAGPRATVDGVLGEPGSVGGAVVQRDEHVGKEEQEEGQAEEDEDVGDVVEAGVGNEFHLLLGGAHEEEARGEEELEGVRKGIG